MNFEKNKTLEADAERYDKTLKRCPGCGSIEGKPHGQNCKREERAK